MTAFIRAGDIRGEFTIVYHDIFDMYHPYIGDKATLYYLYLLRYRHNSEGRQQGKAWPGRAGVVEKFQLSYSTLPQIDRILQAVDLVNIETQPSGRGKEKIIYTVNDPKTRKQFRYCQPDYEEELTKLIADEQVARSLLGKEMGAKLPDE